MATVLTKKYQKKLVTVTKLVDIMTPALAVFETSVSKVLNNGRVDKWEFTMLQTFHLGALNELVSADHKMEAFMMCMLFPLCYLMCYHNTN